MFFSLRYIWLYPILAILLEIEGILGSKDFWIIWLSNLLTERTRWKLFQKWVVHTKLDIYFLTREWYWWMRMWNIRTPYVNSGKYQHWWLRCCSTLTITLSYFTITTSILKTDISCVPYSVTRKNEDIYFVLMHLSVRERADFDQVEPLSQYVLGPYDFVIVIFNC
jgi:hypothetical protein